MFNDREIFRQLNYLWERTDKLNKRVELEVTERVKLEKRLRRLEHQVRNLQRKTPAK